MATAGPLLTIDEYARLPDNGLPTELVRGRVVFMNPPKPRHGRVCARVVRIVDGFAEEQDCGRVLCNDAGVVTERDPDTLRGADVSYYSFDRLPRGPLPETYPDVSPNLVFEVRSPDDRWSAILVKVGEYLEAGVEAVCVLDPATETARVYLPDRPEQLLKVDDCLEFPGVLPGFRVPVRRFFE